MIIYILLIVHLLKKLKKKRRLAFLQSFRFLALDFSTLSLTLDTSFWRSIFLILGCTHIPHVVCHSLSNTVLHNHLFIPGTDSFIKLFSFFYSLSFPLFRNQNSVAIVNLDIHCIVQISLAVLLDTVIFKSKFQFCWAFWQNIFRVY